METDQQIKSRYAALEGILDEHQRRLYAAVEAKLLGHGGVKRVHEATGVARGSILAGMRELEQGISPDMEKKRRIRRVGGGRKKLTDQDKSVKDALEQLVDPVTRGDPESPLLWTCKSLKQLAGELNAGGHKISHVTVGAMLKDLDYSLQGNRKTLEGSSHPDRNAQFEFIVHHKVKTTGFSRSALATIKCCQKGGAAWSTGMVVIRFIRLSITLYG